MKQFWEDKFCKVDMKDTWATSVLREHRPDASYLNDGPNKLLSKRQ